MRNLMRSLCLGCTLCLVQSAAYALGGAQTAALLNARYASTASQCVGRAPAFACSGIVLRTLMPNQAEKFWVPDAAEGTDMRFIFVRKDHVPTTLGSGAGFLLFDRFTALAHGKPYQATQPAANLGEVVVNGWNAQAPGQLAIQGVFYDPGQAGSLLRAQSSQRDYFQATGTWLPLLRLQLGEPQGQVFGFSQQDQLDNGYRVAARLNTRYLDTGNGDDTCRGNRGAFYCRGVLLRTTDVGNFRAWNPSSNSVRGNGVSFSYFRADSKVLRTYKPQGLVIREEAAPATIPLSLRCVFPFDGGTSGRADMCNFRPSCASVGVDSAAAWLARYRGSPYTSCWFSPTAQEFRVANEIRQQLTEFHGWNELMVAAWPAGAPLGLPLEALLYSTVSYVTGNGLAGGKRFQTDYFADTGRTLPLLQLRPMPTDGRLFIYDPNDQALR